RSAEWRRVAAGGPEWQERVGTCGPERSWGTRVGLRRAGTRVCLGPAFLLVVASLLVFCRLRSPLLEPEEARYAKIPRQMLAADRWLVPALHGQDYLDKPPLFYWLVMTGYRVFGVSEATARTIVGLIALLTVAT